MQVCDRVEMEKEIEEEEEKEEGITKIEMVFVNVHTLAKAHKKLQYCVVTNMYVYQQMDREENFEKC